MLVVKMKFVSVASSYLGTSKLTDVSSPLSYSMTPTIFLSLSTSFLCLLPLSFSSAPPLPLPPPPPQLPVDHLHAAIGGCSKGDSDSGGGVKNGGC